VAKDPPLIHLQLADPVAALARLDGAPPPGIRLRTVELPADLPPIVELYNAVFAPGDAAALTPAEFAHLDLHPGISPRGMFLAFAGEQAVGLVVGSVAVPAPGEGRRQGAVELLAVRPAYRGRGIGQALIHAVLAWLVGRGVSQVSASTDNAALPEILARYGFRRLTGNPSPSSFPSRRESNAR
jgi:GNAT superfamily N-acetyltransferase